jgi:glycosyltransferase involved in cell wall biosynthesis
MNRVTHTAGVRRAPHVSVVIPAFNAASTIEAALASVSAQTFQDYELIVVDDGSTDDTAAVVAHTAPGATVVRQENGGPGRARNAGIRASRGRLIAFLDADDEWLPHKLEAQVAYFHAYPQTGLLHTAVAGPAAGAFAPLAYDTRPRPPRHVFCELFHTDYRIATLTVMVRRDVLDAVGLFDERREVHVEDWDLWLRVAARYPIGYLAQPAAVRFSRGAMSADIEKTFRGQAEAIAKNRATCHLGCPLHRAAPAACLRRRWYRFYWELGYVRLRRGRRKDARSAFLRAVANRPFSGSAWVQLAATFAGERWRAAVRRVLTTLGQPRALSGPHGQRETPVSLFDQTAYRRTRRAVSNAAHVLDTAVYRARVGERRRILFEAASPMSFAIYRPVYERLRTDPRFEFWFTASKAWDVGRLYGQIGITERVVPPATAAWMKVDAVVNTDFWGSIWLRRRTRRIHLFHGVAGKYGLDAPVEIAPDVRTYDRLFFPNEDRLNRYVEAGLVPPGSPVAALVGYPKLDALVDGSIDGRRVLEALGFDPARPTVLYAPTWSPYSSLIRFGADLPPAFEAAGFNVIIKLHDRSLDPSHRASGGVDWAQAFAAYGRHPRIRLVIDADATPCLAAADALVTDHSTVGFEFMLLDRPITVIDCPDLLAQARVPASKAEDLRRAAEVADDVGEAVCAVIRQLEDPACHRRERQETALRYFYRPGTATARAVACMYDVLDLELPVRADVAQAVSESALVSLNEG